MAGYSKEQIEKLFIDIIELIEDGLSLRKSVEKLGISTRTFYNWIEKDEVKQQQYARAIICRADSIFEEILDIADDSEHDVIITDKGIEVANSEFIARSRLRVDARKWAVSKMNPKKYGDKVQTELLKTSIDLSNLTEEEYNDKLKIAKKVIGE